MGYNSTISMVFQMQVYFPNHGIHSTQNCSASQVCKAAEWFSKESAAPGTERPLLGPAAPAALSGLGGGIKPALQQGGGTEQGSRPVTLEGGSGSAGTGFASSDGHRKR